MSPLSSSVAFGFSGALHQWRGELQVGLERQEATVELSYEHGFHIQWAAATIWRSAALVALGDPENNHVSVAK